MNMEDSGKQIVHAWVRGMCCAMLMVALVFSPAFSQNADHIAEVESLLDSATSIMFSNPATALALIEDAIEIARQENDLSLTADALHSKSIYHWNRGEFHVASEIDRQTLKMFQSLNDSAGVAYTLNSLGVSQIELGLHQEALKNLLAAHEKMLALEDSSGVQMVLVNLGVVFEKMEDFETAMHYYEKGLEWASQLALHAEMADSYNNMAEIFMQRGEFEKAYELYSKAYQLFKSNGNLDGLALVTLNLGDYYRKTENLELAEKMLLDAANQFSVIEDQHGHCETELTLGKLYRKMQRYTESEELLMRTLKTARTKKYLDIYTAAQRELAQLYYAQEEFDEAYNRFLQYDLARDSIHKLTRTREFDNLRLAYQSEEKERQLEVMRSQREKDQIILAQNSRIRNGLIILAVILFAFSVFGVLMYGRLKSFAGKLEEQQVVLEAKNQQIKEQAEELEAANRKLSNEKRAAEISAEAKAELISELSHEVRTPLNALIGIAHILREEAVSPEQKEYLDALYFAAHNLLLFTNNTLDFSKLEAGKLTLKPARFNPRFSAQRVIAPFRVSNKNRDVDLRLEVGDEVPKTLLGDETRFIQILINLVSNALKYTKKGHVILRMTCAEFDSKCHKLVLSIEDTGIGIPLAMQEKVFGRYDRLGNDAVRWADGSGLGLSITKKLVEWMNGSISFTSKANAGTTFRVEIPFDQDESGTDPNTEKNGINEPLQNRSVLLAEDNEVNIMFTRKLLENLGMKVSVARDVEEAENMALKEHFDLILMDLQMPRKNGIEATRDILNAKPEMTVIALTANANLSIKEELLSSGFQDVIQKPFEPDKLGNYLSKHLKINP